jgi:hypothetical protein
MHCYSRGGWLEDRAVHVGFVVGKETLGHFSDPAASTTNAPCSIIRDWCSEGVRTQNFSLEGEGLALMLYIICVQF